MGECNFFQASFNAVNLLLGVGVLSLPFAVRTSGWAVAVPLLALLSVMTNYTGKLLGRCIEFQPSAGDRGAAVRFARQFPQPLCQITPLSQIPAYRLNASNFLCPFSWAPLFAALQAYSLSPVGLF